MLHIMKKRIYLYLCVFFMGVCVGALSFSMLFTKVCGLENKIEEVFLIGNQWGGQLSMFLCSLQYYGKKTLMFVLSCTHCYWKVLIGFFWGIQGVRVGIVVICVCKVFGIKGLIVLGGIFFPHELIYEVVLLLESARFPICWKKILGRYGYYGEKCVFLVGVIGRYLLLIVSVSFLEVWINLPITSQITRIHK